MKKILIVDDSATMRKIISRVLRQAEIEADSIIEAGNGLEGLEMLLAEPDVDLILSDVNMPQMDGIEFVKSVREKHDKSALPVVMITTEGGDDMIEKAMAEGANGYVTKPFTPDSIKKSLEDIVE